VAIRISRDYHAVGVRGSPDEILWFWIAAHSEYERAPREAIGRASRGWRKLNPQIFDLRQPARVEDWPWSSVHDYTGNVSKPPATTSALAINRVLLPADDSTRI